MPIGGQFSVAVDKLHDAQRDGRVGPGPRPESDEAYKGAVRAHSIRRSRSAAGDGNLKG